MSERELVKVRPPWAARRARRAARIKARAWNGAGRWVFPVLALAAPALGEAAPGYLLGCLLFGAVAALWGAHRTGAVWSILAWSAVTGLFAAALVLLEAPAFADLTVLGLATAALQALALLVISGPATISSWRARGMALLSLAGPLALAMMVLHHAPILGAYVAAAAVSLDLAAVPLALLARRRARP